MNPYLPPWEYIPDGEPHIFNVPDSTEKRVYVYGSHDRAHGYVFCQEDYVCWSAPLRDLTDWRFEGVIYKKTSDPLNQDGHMVLYAPDVVQGADGRYYLYYVLDKAKVVSVAVCDTPAGEYEFYGYVHYADGTRLGERDGDEPQFDPGLFIEDKAVYLYTGLSIIGDASRKGAMVTELALDMLTIVQDPVFIVPGGMYGEGTSFEGHEYFEAPSMRKVGEIYYFIYSSVHMTELCYATSRYPNKDFTYGGCIVSNCDLGISTYKPADKRTYPYGNNHGSIIEVNEQWYVFYHRMTNATWFSRQGCIEQLEIKPDGHIPQVEITSQGARRLPLEGRGKVPAYIACNLWCDHPAEVTGLGASGSVKVPAKPSKITQDGLAAYADCFISDITDGTIIAFKYFDFKNTKKITLTTRAYGRGDFEIRTNLNAPPLGAVSVVSANIWTEFSANIDFPTGIHPLYFTYKGSGSPSLLSFVME